MDAVSPPLNLIEVTEPRLALAGGKRVPFADLANRFDKIWYRDLSLGRVFFRHLGQLGRDEANLEYALEHPEFAQMVQDADILREFQSKGIPLDKPHLEKLEKLNRALIPVQKLHASKCIIDIDEGGKEHKAFPNMRAYDAFLSSLQPSEVDTVYAILREMTSLAPITEESHTLIALAKEYHIPLAEGLTVENMSAEIADALVENAVIQADAARREMSGLKG